MRQVTNLTLRLLLFLGRKRTFLVAFSLKQIFRVSLLNVRLFQINARKHIVLYTSWNGGGRAPSGYCCALYCFFVVVCFGLRSPVGLFFTHSEHADYRVGYQTFTVYRMLAKSLSRRSCMLWLVLQKIGYLAKADKVPQDTWVHKHDLDKCSQYGLGYKQTRHPLKTFDMTVNKSYFKIQSNLLSSLKFLTKVKHKPNSSSGKSQYLVQMSYLATLPAAFDVIQSRSQRRKYSLLIFSNLPP